MTFNRNYLFAALAILLMILAFWFLKTVVLYIVVAAILTMITRPVEKKLERIRIRKRKIPRSVRALIVLFGIYAVIFAFISIFIPVISNEAHLLSNINGAEISKAMHEPLAKLETAFANLPQSGTEHQTLEQYVQSKSIELLSVTQVSTFANSIVSLAGQLIIAFFAVSFFTFFFLKDGPVIFEMLMLLAPANHSKPVRNIFHNAQIMLSKYFTGVLIDVIFVTAFVGTGMAIIGVPNAFIIGLFAGVMNIIPYVGPIIGAAFAIIIGISTHLGLDFYNGILPIIERILIVFLLMNLIDGFLVQPFIFSKRVKAHPIEIFTVILVAGSLLGIGGMIAAVPVYTVIRIIAREFMSKYRFVQRLTDEFDEDSTMKEPENPAT
jgi:predicted PurR-regulated permease PerM